MLHFNCSTNRFASRVPALALLILLCSHFSSETTNAQGLFRSGKCCVLKKLFKSRCCPRSCLQPACAPSPARCNIVTNYSVLSNVNLSLRNIVDSQCDGPNDVVCPGDNPAYTHSDANYHYFVAQCFTKDDFGFCISGALLNGEVRVSRSQYPDWRSVPGGVVPGSGNACSCRYLNQWSLCTQALFERLGMIWWPTSKGADSEKTLRIHITCRCTKLN